MPIYDYACQQCGNQETGYRRIDDRHNGPVCCAATMQMQISPHMVMPDLPGYESPVTGKWIEGRVARQEDLRRSGCRPYELGEKQEFIKQKKASEKANDAKLYDAIAKTYYNMPEQKRRILRNA